MKTITKINEDAMIPRVTVVIPMLNVATYVFEALNSVARQTLKEIEVLCVDAGSTDGTREIVENFAKKDSRFYLIDSSRKSYGYQMNMGLDQAKGEYIGIVEPDDWIESDMYATLVKYADDKNLDFIKADAVKFTGEGDNLKEEYISLLQKSPSLYGKIFDPLEYPSSILAPMLMTCSAIYRKSFLKKINYRYNETPGASFQDTSLYVVTLAAATRCAFFRRGFYHYRRDNSNASSFRKDGSLLLRNEYSYAWEKYLANIDKTRINVLKPWFLALQFAGEVFTFNRLSEADQKEFWKEFKDDFIVDFRNGAFSPKVMPKGHWVLLRRIMDGENAVGWTARLWVCLIENGLIGTCSRLFSKMKKLLARNRI